MIASVRGAVAECRNTFDGGVAGELVILSKHWGDELVVLDELAAALGYATAEKYNEACQARPSQVRRRLKALRAGRRG